MGSRSSVGELLPKQAKEFSFRKVDTGTYVGTFAQTKSDADRGNML